MDKQKALLRMLVDNMYDVQSLRISTGNRLVANLRSLGVIPETEKQKDVVKRNKRLTGFDVAEESSDIKVDNSNDIKVLSSILKEYRLVSEYYTTQLSNKGSIVKALMSKDIDHVFITSEVVYSMVSSFASLYDTEQAIVRIIAKEVKNHPLWDAFFSDVKGCGPAMAAVCIAYFDIYKARWPGSMWKYAGLDVVVDANGSHGRTRSDTEVYKYINKNGEEAEKNGLTYNPKLKTKLVGVLGGSFLKAGADAKYAQIYYGYKNRLLNRPDCADLPKYVIHRRANRYAVKMFLKDLWVAWRNLEGLPTGDDYAVAKLGMRPHRDSHIGI